MLPCIAIVTEGCRTINELVEISGFRLIKQRNRTAQSIIQVYSQCLRLRKGFQALHAHTGDFQNIRIRNGDSSYIRAGNGRDPAGSENLVQGSLFSTFCEGVGIIPPGDQLRAIRYQTSGEAFRLSVIIDDKILAAGNIQRSNAGMQLERSKPRASGDVQAGDRCRHINGGQACKAGDIQRCDRIRQSQPGQIR